MSLAQRMGNLLSVFASFAINTSSSSLWHLEGYVYWSPGFFFFFFFLSCPWSTRLGGFNLTINFDLANISFWVWGHKLRSDTHWLCISALCVCIQSLQLCLTLCDTMDCSLPGSSVHGILQTRILEWVAMPSSQGSFWHRDQTWVSCISCIAHGFFIHWVQIQSHCLTAVWPLMHGFTSVTLYGCCKD